MWQRERKEESERRLSWKRTGCSLRQNSRRTFSNPYIVNYAMHQMIVFPAAHSLKAEMGKEGFRFTSLGRCITISAPNCDCKIEKTIIRKSRPRWRMWTTFVYCVESRRFHVHLGVNAPSQIGDCTERCSRSGPMCGNPDRAETAALADGSYPISIKT